METFSFYCKLNFPYNKLIHNDIKVALREVSKFRRIRKIKKKKVKQKKRQKEGTVKRQKSNDFILLHRTISVPGDLIDGGGVDEQI